MKLQSLFLRTSLLLFAAALTCCYFAPRAAAQSNAQAASQSSFVQTPVVPARITQAIDETQLVRLKGNVHPLARPQFDQGAVSDATPMKRMLMLLQRSPEQEAALQKFMAEQMSNESANFHKWLTPQQFGALYGPADSDIQAVTSWLASHGFTAIRVAPGKNVVEFSGNVGQVRSAFHTEIHQFLVNGETRQSNTSDPQIPAALTPAVAGIVSLHNFPSKSMRRVVGQFIRSKKTGQTTPLFTTSGGDYAVGPADFAKIYNIPASLNGTGANIAIIGFSDIDVTDAHDFRALFNLPSNDPVVVNNGPDPGFNGEEGEADLDTQWAGAVAPNATIHYILSEGTLTSDPLFLGAEFVIDNNSDDVMSLSFGNCEPQLSSAALSFINNLWEQAAAQGITVTVSAGDNGTAGCDDFNTQANAIGGIAVSGIASTPFNIAVGGTDFDDVGTQTTFWSTTNSTDGKRESALGYIHEIPWNDSCAATATPSTVSICANPADSNRLNIVAGSGGHSAVYAKPAWQNGITPNGVAAGDNHRYLPDVSLFAGDGSASNPTSPPNTPPTPLSNSFYLLCQADAITPQPPSPPSCAPDASGHFQFFGAGGTSASAPSFAGIIALIGQSEATAGRSRRQGNANVVLYKIAQTPANSCNSSTQPLAPSGTCVFYNITKNTNSVPCAGTSPNCSSTTSGTNGVLVTSSPAANTPAFNATAGSGSIPTYNLTTGLGSVNVANLATAWGTAVGSFKASASTLLINNSATPASITHGTAATAKVTVAAVAPAAGTPSGDVSILAPSTPTGSVGSGNNGGTLSGGVATISGVILPGGTYNVTAHYAGDVMFSPSDSAGVPITVNKENSRLQYSIVTLDANNNPVNTNATSVPYGSPYILRFDILNSTANACTPLSSPAVTTGCATDATGTVTITDNGSPLTCSPLVPGCTSPFPVNAEGSGEDQPIQLTGGSHSLAATYSGDVSYSPVTTPVNDTVTVTPATTATGVTPSPTSGVTTTTPVTLTALISSQSNSVFGATGNVVFKDGTATIGTVAAVPAGANAVSFAGGSATLTQTFSTTGTHSITAAYAGDQNYAASTSAAANVTVASSGSFTVGGSTTTVAAGSNANSTITVTPTGGFTGMVNVTCPTVPPGVTCSPNPLPINVTGTAAVTGTLTVAVAAPSSTTSASIIPADRTQQWAALAPLTSTGGGKGWWGLSAITGFAAILILMLPGKKRYRPAVSLGLICILSFTLGCSSGYGGGGGGGGTSATTTKISVTSTKVASGTSIAFTVTVTPTTGSRNPTGTVQLYDGTALVGTPGTLASGSATINVSSLSVGTHAISAHYLADAYSTASQSGVLNIAITGSTTFAISASPAASNGSPTVNLTIN